MKVYTLKEAAEKLRYSASRLRSWIKEGRIVKNKHYYNPGPGNTSYRFTEDQIEMILKGESDVKTNERKDEANY